MLNRTGGPAIFLLFCSATFQLLLGSVAWIWAWFQLADPPFLGSGFVREFSALRNINQDSTAALGLLDTLRGKLEWLSESQSEGLAMIVIIGASLILCGLATGLLVIWLNRQVRVDRGARV